MAAVENGPGTISVHMPSNCMLYKSYLMCCIWKMLKIQWLVLLTKLMNKFF
jgi:hypothetical protein